MPIQPLAEVRERLSQLVARFRREGAVAEPVVFGTHRKPEAVLISFDAYRELVEQAERGRAMAAALASVRAEGLEPSADAVVRAVRVVSGEMNENEAYEETLRQYRRS
jgi:PHD/YefM family antitoxin component YafN of YafNO toxin-antitoxin module